MNIIIFGPPGAGKGTQSDKIVSKYQLFKISTGDLLRNEIKNGTLIGKKIEKTVNLGALVSDNIINDLIEKVVSNKKYKNKLVFDGYPRNVQQAKNLNTLLKKYERMCWKDARNRVISSSRYFLHPNLLLNSIY